MTATPAVGTSTGVNSAKYTGWWKITSVSVTGRRLITLAPDTGRGNRATQGVRVPPELLIPTPYEDQPFDSTATMPGTVIAFKASVVSRKPDFAGLWVITDDRGDRVTVFRLGGSDVKIRTASAMFDVVKVEDLASADTLAKYTPRTPARKSS